MDAMNLEQVDGMEYIIDTVYIERKRNIVIPGIQSAMFIHLSFKNIPHTRGFTFYWPFKSIQKKSCYSILKMGIHSVSSRVS